MAKEAEKPEAPTSQASQQHQPIVSNLENAPTIFIDGVQGLSATNDVVKINLYQTIQDFQDDGSEAIQKRLIVGRLAMSPATLILVMEWLRENVKYETVPKPGQTDPSTSDGPSA